MRKEIKIDRLAFESHVTWRCPKVVMASLRAGAIGSPPPQDKTQVGLAGTFYCEHDHKKTKWTNHVLLPQNILYKIMKSSMMIIVCLCPCYYDSILKTSIYGASMM